VVEHRHHELVERAAKWLKSTRKCQFWTTEAVTCWLKEQPDAIGWHNGASILVECKISVPDFYADKRKESRKTCFGVGRLRYYLAPKGVLTSRKLPPFWGLLEMSPKQIRVAVKAREVPGHLVDDKGECYLLIHQAGLANNYQQKMQRRKE
jgi:hypothetical protein